MVELPVPNDTEDVSHPALLATAQLHVAPAVRLTLPVEAVLPGLALAALREYAHAVTPLPTSDTVILGCTESSVDIDSMPICDDPTEVGANRSVTGCCPYGGTTNGGAPAVIEKGPVGGPPATLRTADPLLTILMVASAVCPTPTSPKLTVAGGRTTFGSADWEIRATNGIRSVP